MLIYLSMDPEGLLSNSLLVDFVLFVLLLTIRWLWIKVDVKINVLLLGDSIEKNNWSYLVAVYGAKWCRNSKLCGWYCSYVECGWGCQDFCKYEKVGAGCPHSLQKCLEMSAQIPAYWEFGLIWYSEIPGKCWSWVIVKLSLVSRGAARVALQGRKKTNSFDPSKHLTN